jgi:hypothetical protein
MVVVLVCYGQARCACSQLTRALVRSRAVASRSAARPLVPCTARAAVSARYDWPSRPHHVAVTLHAVDAARAAAAPLSRIVKATCLLRTMHHSLGRQHYARAATCALQARPCIRTSRSDNLSVIGSRHHQLVRRACQPLGNRAQPSHCHGGAQEARIGFSRRKDCIETNTHMPAELHKPLLRIQLAS